MQLRAARLPFPREMIRGRREELRRIEEALEGARAGSGGALALTGEPGIGKTALLLAAGERAAGMTVLSTAGHETERRLPFAALGGLLEPALGGIDELPDPQAAALRAALALGPPVPPDPLAVCVGTLGLLDVSARGGPVALLVDDAHWLDAETAACLAYCARRLERRPIALLATLRDDESDPLGADALRQLTVGRLEEGTSRELLAELAPDLPGGQADEIVRLAAGNPLALHELPSLLSDEQLRGEAPIDDLIAPRNGLRAAFRRRIEILSPAARGALLVAAAAPERLGPVAAACGALDYDHRALEEAEEADMIAIKADRVVFAHPLLRGTVYQGAGAGERRRVHAALAAADDDETSAAWHLARAAVGPDEAAAAALEAVAGTSAARGAFAAATDAFERAAELSEAASDGAQRLLAAGLAAAAGGANERAVAVLARAAEAARGELRITARHALAMVSLWAGGNVADGYRMLVETADEIVDDDPVQAAELHADAGVASVIAGDCRSALEHGLRARQLIGQDGDATVRAQALSILAWSLTLRGRAGDAREVIAELDPLLADVDPLSPAAQSIALSNNSRIATEDYRRAREENLALIAAAEESGGLGAVPFPLVTAADCAHRIGDWDDAEREIARALELAEETGQRGPLTLGLIVAAYLAAGRGEEDESRAAVERALAIAEPAGIGCITTFGHGALGFLELSLGRIDSAVAELERVAQLAEAAGLEDPTLIPWAPDLVEAYARRGELDAAARTAAGLAEQAERAANPLALALAARCRGLVAEDFDAEFAEALELHDRTPAPFERARTLLVYGERLHRARRRIDARERLRESLETFERLRAEPWAERARAELRAAGAIDREPVYPDELTAQELRIALAAAGGATNKQIAAELFLSPKTIEFHLGRVYSKLGIRSRTRLAALVADGELGDPRERHADALGG